MNAATPQPTRAQWLRPFERFVQSEAAGGIVLLVCTVLALGWANSSWSTGYTALLHHPIRIGAHGLALQLTVHGWINDCLMAAFFFLVGLEIKRELCVGELASIENAALPIVGAAGGMIAPALIYWLLNAHGSGARGWGIPMATDIAFALGVVALLGSRIPMSLRLFLAAVAIVDDIGAVLVIAIFYTASIAWSSLAIAGMLFAVLCVFNMSGVRSPIPFVLLGVLLWLAVLASGVHATIAGVLLAMTIPARATGEVPSLLARFEHALHLPVAFLIVPLFALANAGVRLVGAAAGAHSTMVITGVVLGLVLGKPIGIFLASWLAVRARIAALPSGVSWRLLFSVSCLGGIGFTMSLFIGALAFDDLALLDSAKIGVLVASCCAAGTGWLLLRSATPATR